MTNDPVTIPLDLSIACLAGLFSAYAYESEPAAMDYADQLMDAMGMEESSKAACKAKAELMKRLFGKK